MKIKKIMEFVIPALAGIVIALILNIFVGVVQVDGHSMDTTLHDRQLLLMQKQFVDYEIGDIVVANITHYGTGEKKTIIKRIIATEGQTIEIKNGILYRDGVVLDEPYIKEAMDNQSFEKITVPEGEVYLMGDNRNNSLDSRIQGTIKISDLQGKIINK